MDEIRVFCEDAGGAHTWLHDDLGSTEAFEWEGPQGQLQVSLDPVFGPTYVLHVDDGEILTDDLESVEHLRRLVEWLEKGGEIPES